MLVLNCFKQQQEKIIFIQNEERPRWIQSVNSGYMTVNYGITQVLRNFIWDKVFKNEPSEICERQPLKL